MIVSRIAPKIATLVFLLAAVSFKLEWCQADVPQRIVALAPSLAEIAADLLGESELVRIVGVSENSDVPPEMKRVRSIGPYNQVNLEAIVSLHPDLVIATRDGNSQDQVQHLRDLGLNVLLVRSASFDEIRRSIEEIGKAVGKVEKANAEARHLEDELSRIKRRALTRTRHPSVLIELDRNPLIVAGRASFLSEAVKTIGAINAYDDLSPAYPRPKLEDAVLRDPDVIVIVTLGKDAEGFESAKKDWYRFSGMKAVREKKVVLVSGDRITRPTPGIVEGLRLLERAVYGE